MSTVLVAGGASGIGAAAVRALRQRGDDVLLADRNAEAGRRLAAEPMPGALRFLACDFSAAEAAEQAVAAAVELGGGTLDAMFYNAAVLQARPLADWTVAEWDHSSAVNLRAPFLACQAAAPYLQRAPQGRIVLTSSTGALRGHAGMPAYHATKAGLLGLVRSLADELGPSGVTVNAVCPGWVDTPFNDAYWSHQTDPAAAVTALTNSIPLRRQAVSEDLAGVLLFLMSPASGYITGQALVVDGGYTAV
ncbi:SDR family NAD(P)-dependent oxidoreductase [uncultured Friedmanniella sp.]|uniref:SDR family NAD(P)-dependent oxidoreductase n=1 Tax=uncultured Friedmanniella sp. TaxID=335381 RepID=UPI0035CA59A6